MTKIILAVNAGSSSVKISVFAASQHSSAPQQLAECQVSGLTSPTPAQLSYTRTRTTSDANPAPSSGDPADADHPDVTTQDDAFKLLLQTLISDKSLKQISSAQDIAIVCHRIVHGGDYATSQIITADTYHHLEALSDLAPLHNGAALTIVASCRDQLPQAVNLACFDSQFHFSSLAPAVYTYMIDPDIARNNKLRKYGFHGISYAFIVRAVAHHLRRDQTSLNLIALHLGSGASACAIRHGRSWDTTMGLTPLSGLPGATRSGTVDPSLVFHYASDVGKLSPASTSHLHISKAEEILNKQSGWKALTGTTDFGTISAGLDGGEEDASDSSKNYRLAFDIFADRIASYIGSYYVSLGGQIDALVFAGGIGEKGARLREEVIRRVACLGFDIDGDKNQGPLRDTVQDITSSASASASASSTTKLQASDRPKVLVVKTDEQLEMARMSTEKAELWS